MKIDAGIIQDLYHYSLSMQGDSNSAFPCETLCERLAASNNCRRKLEQLDPKYWQEWDDVIPRTDRITSVDDLVHCGQAVQSKVEQLAKKHGVDPRSGESFNA